MILKVQTRTLVFATIALGVTRLVVANAPPVVFRVAAAKPQDGSKIFDIRHRLTDANGDARTASVGFSNKEGSTSVVPMTAACRAARPSSPNWPTS